MSALGATAPQLDDTQFVTAWPGENTRDDSRPTDKPERRPRRKKYRVNGVKIALVAAACYTIVSLVGQYTQTVQLNTQIQQLEAQYQQEQTTNAELQQTIARLQGDPSYVEFIARQKLGMVKEGEVQYIFRGQ